MATYYWVGGTGDWTDDASSNSHWSLTSGGAPVSIVTGSTDDVIFDQNGPYTVRLADVSGGQLACRNITVTGSNVTFTHNGINLQIYGSMSLASSTNWTSSSPDIVYINFTSGTSTISASGTTFGCAISCNSGSLTLSTNITISSGTFVVGGTVNLNGFSLTAPKITQNSGTLNFNSSSVSTIGQYLLSGGTLNLNGNSLTCQSFSSSGSTVRSISFGSTGSITTTGTGTVWDTATGTNLTTSGSRTVTINNNTATATSILGGTAPAGGICNFNVINGTYALTASGNLGDLILTGFGGSLAGSTRTIYGSLTLSSSGTFSVTASNNLTTFAGTTTGKTITSNGKTIDFSLYFDGVGGSWILQDNLTMGSTRTLSHTNGTIDLNGKTLTVGTQYTTVTGTKNLTFNAGVLVCPASGATAFRNNAPTGYTTTAGAGGPGEIRMTSATAKTFVGAGSNFACTLVQAGAGALTISGSNTFYGISNTVYPCTITFTASTTTTVSTFTASGNPSFAVTLNSSTAGTNYTLTKTGGGVVSCNYLNISYSTATPSTLTWYAGTGSVNTAGNTGWIFTAPPSVANTGAFFSVF